MSISDHLYTNYNLKIKNTAKLTNKTYKIICNQDNCFFVKKVNPEVENKYNFLSNQGVNNVLYPTINKDRKFISNSEEHSYYLSDYIENYTTIEDSAAYNMFYSLNRLHDATTFKRQLSVFKAKPKFEEITKQLDYKFKLLENYIRSIETKEINQYSIVVLENYHIILDAKKELVKIQKRIIQSIKDKESVEYSFVHNNPKIDHLIMSRGSQYLTSIENGKIGINSLDIAKFYVENNNLNLDFKKIIYDDYYSHKQDFYYDYFRFLVLFIYIKRINVTNLSYISMENFVHSCREIEIFLQTFSDKKLK